MGDTAAAAFLIFVTLGLGIYLWSLSMAQTEAMRARYYQDVASSIMQQKSFLVVENVAFKDGDAYVTLYNCGDVALKVFCITIAEKGGMPTPEFRDIVTLGIQEAKTVTVPCSLSGELLVRVDALPLELFVPDDPSLNVHWGVMIEVAADA